MVGGHAVIQTDPARGRLAGHGPGPETYLIEVAGVAGTTGRYSLEVILNSAVEDESHGGDSNNTLADAQDLDLSFIALHNAVGHNLDGAAPQPTRGAVRGTFDTVSVVVGEVEPNQPAASGVDLLTFAQDVSGDRFSRAADPSITDSTTVPHISIEGTGDGSFDYYFFAIDAPPGAAGSSMSISRTSTRNCFFTTQTAIC